MRELRIAPVMTGGTSLAVWMGGVTAELYRLLRSQEESKGPRLGADDSARAAAPFTPEEDADVGQWIYRSLLDLTGSTPVVDVVTGTSAGGLNGTLITAALRCGLTTDAFMGVRDTWMGVGDIEKLLRSAHDPNPPSLLKGDEYFVPELRRLLERWNRRPQTDVDVDLVTTLTTVTGVPNSRSDDFSEAIPQLDHAQRLRFRKDDFEETDWPHRLAIAARTSASIPAVFEPSFIPIGAADARASKRPDFRRNASFSESRWAVDGGVVVNLPLTEAIDRIYERKATTDVRRVVLYVSPTPGEPKAIEPDEVTKPPDIRTTLATSVTAVRAEGVAADIDLIRRANEQVDRQERTRRFLRPVLEDIGNRAEYLFAEYRASRARSSIARMLAEVRAATTKPLPADDETIIGWFLQARLDRLPADLDELPPPGETSTEAVTDAPPPPPAAAAGTPADHEWRWGIAPVEEAASIVIGLISRAERLLFQAPENRDQIDVARRRAHGARIAVGQVRDHDTDFWRARVAQLPQIEGENGLSEQELRDWAQESYDLWAAGSGPTSWFARLAHAHRMVAKALDTGADAILRVAVASGATDHPGGAIDPDNPTAAEAQAIFDELRSLRTPPLRTSPGDDGGDGADGQPSPPDDAISVIQRQLLRTHVAQTLLLGDVVSREQRVELMQVSWNAWNGLDPDRDQSAKLAGPELARLGAFVKPSWRANDWAWGRMDGAYRLILLLLDPGRIRMLGYTKDELAASIATLAGFEGPERLDAAVIEELAKAIDPQAPLPAMSETAHLLATRAQTAIAQDELPRVARAVEVSREQGGNEFHSVVFAEAVRRAEGVDGRIPAALVPGLVRQMQIGVEGVRNEFGYGLLNRVGSRVSAVAVNAITGTRSGLPILPRFLRPLRVPLHAVNSVAGLVTGPSPLARAAAAFVMAAAGAIVALNIVGIDTPIGTFLISALLLTGLFVGAMFRSGFVYLGCCFALGAIVIALTLAGPDVKAVFYDSTVAVSTSEISTDDTIDAPDDAVIRIITGGDEDGEGGVFRDETLTGDGVRITFPDEGFTLEQPAIEEIAGWKKWGFLDPLNAFRVVVIALGLLLLRGCGRTLQANRRRRRRTIAENEERAERAAENPSRADPPLPVPSRRAVDLRPVLGAISVVAVVSITVVYSVDVFTAWLTGTAPEDDASLSGIDAVKNWITEVAIQLNEVELTVVLVGLVLVSLLLTFGTDVFTSRFFRQGWAGLRRWISGHPT